MAEYEWSSCKILFEEDLERKPLWSFVSNAFWVGSDEDKYKKSKKYDDWIVVRFRCVSCGETHDVPCCSNCEKGFYEAGYSKSGTAGLFCKNCGSGFTSWNCTSCGTTNPIENSLEHLRKKGCFIATAVYGSYQKTEVIILRKYRDDILLSSKIGQIFVRIYYFLSPPFASY